MIKNLNDFLNQEFQKIKCPDDTRAYLISVFDKYKNTNYNGNLSITLSYADAKNSGKFDKFQELADYLFFIHSLYPESLDNKEYSTSIARMSYYTCYRLLNKQWKVYEQIADDFVYLEKSARKILLPNK
jgi:hypothetical protein